MIFRSEVGEWLLNWATYAVSLFNLVLLLWLGLTVLLNAQGRSWGTWLAGSGLLVGAIFFALHTVALDYSLDTLLENSPVWWFILATPVVALPYGWLVLMLWYCGLAGDGSAALRWRVLMPALMASGLGIILVMLALVAAPQIGASPFVGLEATNWQQWQGLHIGLWLYPPFLVLCTATALLALAHPAPSGQWQREASRRRAWPYLFASSLVQLAVSVAVAGALLYFGVVGTWGTSGVIYTALSSVAKWLYATDFALCLAIAIAVMLLGKAVVSFEIFTGKILPRRGFWRQWRAVVLLAGVYAGSVATALGFEMRGIYPLLLSTILLGTFLAIFSFRSYTDHARGVNRIAPFVSSGHLLEGLVSGDEARLNRAVDEPFRALCEDVLNAGRAALIPRAEIAPLFGESRVYPPHLPLRARWRELASEDGATPDGPHAHEVRSLPKDCGMDYLVPLGRSTPLGALLLGPRRDGGLYTLEEIEIARATGEHLLDSQAGATLAARLVALQREKVAEVVTLDRHARRVLHDEILPLLHAALLFPDGASEKIMTAHKGISNLLRELPVASPLTNRTFFEALRHEVEIELSGAFDAVTWDIAPTAAHYVENLPPFLASTLFFAAREALRNAARHGRGAEITRTLTLHIGAHFGARWELEISDDGAGPESLEVETEAAVKGGSGTGLSLHAALLAVAGGSLSLEKGSLGGTRIKLSLPV